MGEEAMPLLSPHLTRRGNQASRFLAPISPLAAAGPGQSCPRYLTLRLGISKCMAICGTTGDRGHRAAPHARPTLLASSPSRRPFFTTASILDRPTARNVPSSPDSMRWILKSHARVCICSVLPLSGQGPSLQGVDIEAPASLAFATGIFALSIRHEDI